MLEQSAVITQPAGLHVPLHRVLVAFDGSPGGWAALRHGIAVAASRNAILTIAAVVPEPPWFVGVPPMYPPWTRQSLLRDAERYLERQLAAARDEVPAEVSVSTAILHGRPARALADLADGGRYDLVVTGPRRIGRRWGRSVTGGLLARCHAPVLAVEPED